MNEIEELLQQVHKMTGGYGVQISTKTTNAKPDEYHTVVKWRVSYTWRREYAGKDRFLFEQSQEREVIGNGLAAALRQALKWNAEWEIGLCEALTKKLS